ncbi:MAG: hypothetical protein FWD66_10125 [Paludibacter sp.]|nr:hypothetical protein [Paludibacter sp.]
MARLKMLRFPPKPRISASVAQKERYLERVRDIEKQNSERTKLNKKSEELDKKIAAIKGQFRSRKSKS